MVNTQNFFSLLIVFLLACLPLNAESGEYAPKILRAGLISSESGLLVDTQIDYQLSPAAKEALTKGVALVWKVRLELRRPGLFWNKTVYRQKLTYTLQYHALLNQYAVEVGGQSEMFLSLNAALNYMATLHPSPVIDPALIGDGDQLAIKTQFRRESLPVPLRPFAYLDPQWSLSSDWFLWPIPK